MNTAIVWALAAVGGLFLSGVFGLNTGDGDLSWQRQLGEAVLRTHRFPGTLGPATFSAPNARWIPHEWVFATLWALAGRWHGEQFFRVGCAALGLLTFIIQARRSRGAARPARVLMLVIVAGALSPVFGLRAHVLGWPLLALLMLALESGPRRAWFALPIAIAWYNLHASALIVPCIVIIDGIGRMIEHGRLTTMLSRLALAAACALGSLATPFGLALPRFALAWSSNSATGLIYEWAPASPDKILVLFGSLVIAGLLVAGECRGARLTWPQRLLALALFAATMLHIRNLSLFCIVTGPWAAYSLAALLPRRSALPWRGWRSDGGLVGIALVGAIGFVILRLRVPVAAAAAEPAVADLMALHGPLRVACEDFSWCSGFAGDSNVRVFLDGRTDAYPDEIFADYRRILRGDALPVFARWHVDAAIVHAKGLVAPELRAAGWELLRSGEPQVYVRRAHAVAIEKT